MKIEKVIQLLIFLITFIGLFSCTSEEVGGIRSVDDENIPIRLPVTRAINGTATEDLEQRVGTVRLIIVKNNRIANNNYRSGLTVDSTSVIIHDMVPTGEVDYFLIANEKTSWNLDSYVHNMVVQPSVIKNKILEFNAYPVVNGGSDWIPMVNYYEKLEINDNATAYHQGVDVTSLLGDLSRLYAKTSLTLTCDYSQLQNGGDPIELKSICVKRMPKESYLVADYYDGASDSDYFDGADVLAQSNYTIDGNGFSGDFSFFIPEHLVLDTANRTYLSAVVGLVNAPAITIEYKIVIGDSIGIDKNNYMLKEAGFRAVRVSRNTHYKFTAMIEDFDQSSNADIDIIAEILAWNEGNIDPGIPKEYYLEVTPSSDFVIAAGTTGDFEATVTVDTNYTGWTCTASHNLITATKSSATKLSFTVPTAVPAGNYTVDIEAGSVTKQIKITKQ